MPHMIVARSDDEIVEDSWDVVGLRGTGSKDVIVRDAVVPGYRTMAADEVMDDRAQRNSGLTRHVPGATFHASALSSSGADPAGALRASICSVSISRIARSVGSGVARHVKRHPDRF